MAGANQRCDISRLTHNNFAGAQSFIQSEKFAGVMRVCRNHRKDCQIAMPDWREYLKTSARADLTASHQAGNDYCQPRQNDYRADQEPHFLAHNPLLSKHTPPRTRPASECRPAASRGHSLSCLENGKKSASCV